MTKHFNIKDYDVSKDALHQNSYYEIHPDLNEVDLDEFIEIHGLRIDSIETTETIKHDNNRTNYSKKRIST